MAISLFKAFEYAQHVSICKAEFKDNDAFVVAESAYNDRDKPIRENGEEAEFDVDLLLITPTEHDHVAQFEEQYIEIDEKGVAVAKSCAGVNWALKFRMLVPVTEQEVREHQVRQLISR